jgi:CheY-like chemotaxis protein
MMHRQPRTWNDIELALRQLGAIQQWLRDAARSSTPDPAGLDRQRRALTARTHEQLILSGAPLQLRLPRRLVLAHRNDRFADKLEHALRGTGLLRVSRVRDADEAVGCVVAEQPDVLLAEDELPGMQMLELLENVMRYSPHCAVGVQVQDCEQVGRLLDAGGAFVCHRHVPPVEVAEQLVKLTAREAGLHLRTQPPRRSAAALPAAWATE